jgi:hypothetical protein
MRNGLLASVATLVTGAGLALGQTNPPAGPPTSLPDSPVIVRDARFPAPAGNAANPNLLPGDPSKNDAKNAAPPSPTELPATPLDPGFGVSLPDGPNAFNDKSKDRLVHRLFDIDGPGQYWGSLDYLLWTIKRENTSTPLLTTGTPQSQGIPGNPGASTLLGGNSIDFGQLSGGKFTFGFCNESHTIGFEAGAFMLETGDKRFSIASDAAGNLVLARPCVNVNNGAQTVSLVSFPGAFAGAIGTNASTDLWGGETNLLLNLNNTMSASVDFILGFRYLQLDEGLGLLQASQVLPGGVLGFNGTAVLAPSIVSIQDQLNTHNEFYGGQVGVQADFKQGPFFAFLSSKVALGSNYESSRATGQTSLISPTQMQTVNGGLLASGGNLGLASRSVFTIVPEGNVTVGMEVTKNVRFYAGYTFMYWEDVTRPGTQVSARVNPSTVPSSLSFGSSTGTNQTMPSIVRTDFWAQGLNVGFAFRY